MLSEILREVFFDVDDIRCGNRPLDQMALTVLCGVLLVCIADAERLEASSGKAESAAVPEKSGTPLHLTPERLPPKHPCSDDEIQR